MALGAFGDKERRPGEADLRAALGASAPRWFSLIERLSARYPPMAEEWAFPGQKYGWSLRLVHRKRRILYLTPQEDKFLAGLVLSDKAVAAAAASELPGWVLDELHAARRYAEGRGIRLEVGAQEHIRIVELLVAIKIES